MRIADEESKEISFTPVAARAAAKNLTVTATNYPRLTTHQWLRACRTRTGNAA